MLTIFLKLQTLLYGIATYVLKFLLLVGPKMQWLGLGTCWQLVIGKIKPSLICEIQSFTIY